MAVGSCWGLGIDAVASVASAVSQLGANVLNRPDQCISSHLIDNAIEDLPAERVARDVDGAR